MPNTYFQFKQFTVHHDRCAMKVTTDSCVFGAWCAQQIKNGTTGNKTLLDIGTGTSLLSLMIAQKNDLLIDAVEIDTDAAAQAKENITSSPWKNNITVFHNDILSFQPNKKYDFIISNPPFYENELASGKHKKDLAHHSYGLSLAQLLYFIKNHLAADGQFFLLLPYKRMKETEDLILKHELFIHTKLIVQQSVTHSPFRIVIKASRKNIPSNEVHLSITDENRHYTQDFIALLKDYYLHL